MRYQYYFCERASKRIVNYLDERKISYKPQNPDVEELIVFSVWSNNEKFDTILKELQSLKVGPPLVFVTYSATEINNAKLLVMTPKKQVVDIV